MKTKLTKHFFFLIFKYLRDMKQFYVHNKLKKHKKAIKSLKAFIYKIQLKSEENLNVKM